MVESNFWIRSALIVGVFVAVAYLIGAVATALGTLGGYILIVFLAYLVGSLLIHIVNSLMRIPHMRRSIAIALVYLALLTLIADFVFLVIPATADQVTTLAEGIPDWIPGASDWVSGQLLRIESLFANYGLKVDLQGQARILINSLAERAQTAGTNSVELLGTTISIVFNTLFIVALSFFVVLDGGRRLDEALKVLPPRAEEETRFILKTIDQTFNGYIRGMLVVSLIYGLGTATVMLATGLPAALPVAIISSILLAIPFVGDWLAIILPVIIAIAAGDFIDILIVLATLLFIQQVMLNLLTPRILGHAVRMPAMFVIIAVVLGVQMAGLPGALLGVPTTAVIYTLAVNYGTRIRQRREAKSASGDTSQK